ncbi:MAG: hypothetical protein ACKOXG_00345 [Arenimonas sp.]
MTKKTKTPPPEVLATQEALQRAEHARLTAVAELERATQATHAAAQALQEARVRADDHLPKATMCTLNWANKPNRRELVIERRTAKTIVTRYPGGVDEQQWRKGSDGRWLQWPDRGSIRVRRWLEVEEGGAA